MILIAGCEQEATPDAPEESPPVTHSLTGEPLYAPTFTPERLQTLQANLDEAAANYAADPNDVETIIWLGRRTAYLWRYQEAVDIFTHGIERFPDEPKLYRHRGHRYITLRQFDNAIADLERAVELMVDIEDEIEPDGQPNAAGIPLSSLHTNVFYHLGLAYYLEGRFEEALNAYFACLAASRNDDMRVATADWMYMTLRRLGLEEEGDVVLESITPDMELLENFSYHRRLLMYKGLMTADELLTVEDEEDRSLTLATQGYGVGNWYLYNGDTEKAKDVYEDVLAGDYWAAFGYIAAEADMARGLE